MTNVERNKPDTRILVYDPIYIKFKNKQNNLFG